MSNLLNFANVIPH